MKRFLVPVVALLGTLLLAPPAQAERVKDLAQVAGVRGNPLIGYGLVVGLDGSGDRTSQTPFTVQSLKTMLDQLGVAIPPGVNPQLKNVAAVAVHAELPAFAKPGQPIDVTVSSIGNAGSLRGGSLLMTQLKGADGEVYAIAQGSLVVSGFGASGRDGSRISVNAPNGGRIPSGRVRHHRTAKPARYHWSEDRKGRGRCRVRASRYRGPRVRAPVPASRLCRGARGQL